MSLKGKNIILGITGGIAAYKSAYLARLLVNSGASVRVIMSRMAKEFISPLTMATLTKHPIFTDFYSPENGDWNSHVDLGIWADCMVIAPATSNSIAKMANGICDNLLLTTYLSAKSPVFIAPSMDLDMYAHKATRRNIATLKAVGNQIIEATSGELASGLHGKGRMEEPEKIIAALESFFTERTSLQGKTFLVTAGPTYEMIDPVRFIGNYSSGKMGYAIAEELTNRGAKVILISGPVNIEADNPAICVVKVTTANEMYNESITAFKNCDGAVMAAAVADYTPVTVNTVKMKKKEDKLTIELIPTKDIAAELGKQKKSNQLLIGFALETDNEMENATNKLKTKNLDFIVLNSLKDKGAGFQYNTNKITIVDKAGTIEQFGLKPKKDVAKDIVMKIINLC